MIEAADMDAALANPIADAEDGVHGRGSVANLIGVWVPDTSFDSTPELTAWMKHINVPWAARKLMMMALGKTRRVGKAGGTHKGGTPRTLSLILCRRHRRSMPPPPGSCW